MKRHSSKLKKLGPFIHNLCFSSYRRLFTCPRFRFTSLFYSGMKPFPVGDIFDDIEAKVSPDGTCGIQLLSDVDVSYPIKQCSRRTRAVKKNGFCGIRKKRITSSFTYYFTDLFTSLVDCRWRYLTFWYCSFMVLTWYLFGVLWWVIAYAHEDLKTTSSPLPLNWRVMMQETVGKILTPNGTLNALVVDFISFLLGLSLLTLRQACVEGVEDMLTAFLFSLETQFTTGYGSRTPTPECPEAVFLLCVQSLFAMISQTALTGIIFTKMARPKARSLAIKFSEKAVVCLRDGTLCLMFKVADVRKSPVVACSVSAWLLKSRVSAEGEFLFNHRRKLQVSIDGGGSSTFLLWPVTVVHKIQSKSPLYDISALELCLARFEIAVSLICTVEATGQQVEARCSYLPSEIIWGHRFTNVIRSTVWEGTLGRGYGYVSLDPRMNCSASKRSQLKCAEIQKYICFSPDCHESKTVVPSILRDRSGIFLDYTEVDRTVQVDTPLCSARQLKTWSNLGSPITSDGRMFEDDHDKSDEAV